MHECKFAIETVLRIDWSELDYFGHVNNLSIFKYVQSSRVNYLETIGLSKMHLDTNTGPILASCKCDFKIPLFYPGQVTILSTVESIKNTSFSIFHRILNEKSEIAAEAKDIIVVFDFNRNHKVPIPAEILKKIEEIESGKD
jgi:acyl-CoA thioester hydrolase